MSLYKNDQKAANALADALHELPENWLMCRDMRHAWEVQQDYHVTKAAGSKIKEIRRFLVCLRCKTRRRETYHIVGWGLEKVSQSYEYPENYQIHGVPRGIKPSFIVQGEMYRRTMERVAELQQEEA